MIQIIFMDKRKFINSYVNYKEKELKEMFKEIRNSINKNEDSIIEISLWDDKTKERK